jgi:hypothetical protein
MLIELSSYESFAGDKVLRKLRMTVDFQYSR